MVLLRFICCMFIFLCGACSGVCIMCLLQISKEIEENKKSFEEKYNDLIVKAKEEEKTFFTYDSLNDPDEDKNIPKIN